MDRLCVNSVTFRAEQDGPTEQGLKTKLVDCLSSEKGVTIAYLVCVSYGESSEQKVALCLKGDDRNAQKVVRSIGDVFRKTFKSTESLDILFLTESQLQEVSSVARPFYCVSK